MDLVLIILGIPIIIVVLHTGIRIVRHFYKFPMPQFLANAIDNPIRRRIQPPVEMPIRHGIEPGMTVLEVGPGNGNYTVATAQRVGDGGRVFTIDIETRMIERVEQRAISEGINNIEARVADVFDLPFDTEYFDVVYMIAVIGEIPSPKLAMKEFSRVLKSSGLLAFSEILFDPDYPRAGTLIRLTSSAGFRIRRKIGNLLSYTLVFEKPECQAAEQLAGADQGCTGKKPGKSEIGYLSVVYGLVRWSKVKSWMAEILTVFDFVRSMIIGV